MGTLILFSLLALLVVVLLAKGIRIVKQSEAMIVERLGKYHGTLESGINVIIPVIDRPRQINWRYTETGFNGEIISIFKLQDRIDLRENVYDFPKQNVITRDNVVTEINALIYFQIVDPLKSVYEIGNLPNAIEKLTQTTLRNVVGEMDLDQCLSSRDTINAKLRAILDDATNKWGVKVNRVELQDINPPLAIRDAMEKQMRAERTRRATILEAEGEKGSQILTAEGQRESDIQRAEGQKQSAILEAEGQAQARIRVAQAEAEAIKLVSEAVKGYSGDPVQYLIAQKYLETLNQMTSGNDTKTVFLPYEASGILSSLGGIKELLKSQG
ncbi:MAG: SPFH/Band 7/PHB domain protein [Schleiferiaceae bacterium]|jgi:regulator of protease activity HflC (stomatin/prohibitin superfamily)|nr:SPFH/Band 7/PHB domain protein [Schleiferiaceae bacterium]MDP5014493.1 SPFH/Band 7/PHB domain protein [Schleiferiaceae bacterium]